MIKLENVSFKYKNNDKKKYILKDITLTIQNSEFISIIGGNGEGKSTLVKLISGITPPSSGNILINNINTKSKRDFINLRKTISVVFQNPDNQIIFERVYEELKFTLENLKIDKDEIELRIDNALEKVNMLNYKYEYTSHLSMGQKQKIIIAEALALNTDIIILDEPTAMLDPISKKQILDLLKTLNQSGKTIILVTHILDEIFYSNRCIYLNDKTIEDDFNINELINNKTLLNKINKDNSNLVLTLISNCIENNINLNLNDYFEKEINTKLSFSEYLNNKIIEKLKTTNRK